MPRSEPSPKRRKRTAEEAKGEILAAARRLLISGGPSAVTLAAVGQSVGMSHANVIHHFGSAAELQSALMGRMVADLQATLTDAVAHIRTDAAMPARLTASVFEAFDEGGAGRLAAWIMLSDKDAELEPVRAALNDLVAGVERASPYADAGSPGRIRKAVLLMALCAMGDALIGRPLRAMLHESDDAARTLVADTLTRMLDET